MELLSKGSFAKHIGVSAGRVSQMIASGMIDADAIDGAGRNSKIKVPVAMAQISSKRDIGQALGNGIGTKLNSDTSPTPIQAQEGLFFKTPIENPTIEDEIKKQRLERERRINRKGAEDEALNKGVLMETDAVRAEMNRIAINMMVIFEGALTEFASAISAHFELPQRDVLHELKKTYLEVREEVSKKENLKAKDFQKTDEINISRDSHE